MTTLQEQQLEDEAQKLTNLQKLTIQCGTQDSGQNYRSTLDPKVFQDVADILRKRVNDHDQQFSIDADVLSIITQTFRFLRNAVAGCKRNQDLVREETDIVSSSNRVLEAVARYLEINGEGDIASESLLELNQVVARCTLQFLVNFMVDNLDNGRVLLSSNTLISISGLLKRTGDEKIVEYAAMNFHTLLKLLSDAESSIDLEIIPTILSHTHLEFVMYLVETLCTSDQFMTSNFPSLSVEIRVKLIRVIVAHTELHEKFSEPIATFFSDQFKQKSDLIFKSQLTENDEWAVWEIATLLEVLCCLSALDESFKTDSSLLTTAIFLLKSIHSTSKQLPSQEIRESASSPSSSALDFSPVSDIEAMKVSSDTEELRSRPSFQFKAHLIRLIANLTHRNFSHQEIVRETEILPVILDSCKIDARNPFITQWAVLAVRNACEGNPANQELVRSVQQVDTVKTINDPKVQMIGL